MIFALGLDAATPAWLDLAGPLLTPAEKKLYLAATPVERIQLEQDFWADKAISREEYLHRLAQVDARFGSDKRASGANTDQGRIWLSIGAPVRVKRLPSSRVFVPLEIWYYDTVPGVLNTELRLIFFQKNSTGTMTLYAPGVDSIRTLLVPQAATRSMFGPNDSATESDIRKILRTGPAEDEVITAAVNVATGIKYTGNQEVLAQITSPRQMLIRHASTNVQSRLINGRAVLQTFESHGPTGASQIDFRLEATAATSIEMEILSDTVSVYRNRLDLQFGKPQPLTYLHRLDLLPGTYRALVTLDGAPNIYPLIVTGHADTTDILRADPATERSGLASPFEFDGKRFEWARTGRWALVPLTAPGKVRWMIRRGSEVVWHANTEGTTVASVELPSALPPASYRMEAVMDGGAAMVDLSYPLRSEDAATTTVLSYNANLASAERTAFIGHQWLLRGKSAEARRYLSQVNTEGAIVDLARLDALEGKLDAARNRVRFVLVSHPDSFEALSVFAFVETQFQDYEAAADLYRRALAVQDSPTLRAALASLPSR